MLGENVEWDTTHTLVDILGSIDVDVTGTIQDQISQLFNEKVSATQLQNYVASQLNEDVSSWLNTNVNPVGSAVVVDSSLTISGAAADAKIVGDNVSDLKSVLDKYLVNIYQHTYTSSGTSLVNYELKEGEKYILRNISESTAVALMKNNSGSLGNQFAVVYAGETVAITMQETMQNFYVYRNSSVSVDFSIS